MRLEGIGIDASETLAKEGAKSAGVLVSPLRLSWRNRDTSLRGACLLTKNCRFLSPIMLEIWISGLDQADRLESQRSSPRQTRDPSYGSGREWPERSIPHPMA